MRLPLFFVDGRPVPQGSKRSPVAGVVRESSPGLHAWRDTIGLVARAKGWLGAPAEGPVAVGLVFVQKRPAKHFQKDGRKLRPDAPVFPGNRPDVDKLTRAVLDALTGICWCDDSRVVVARQLKVFGPREGVGVLLAPIVGLEPGVADLWQIDSDPTTAVRNALAWWPSGQLERP